MKRIVEMMLLACLAAPVVALVSPPQTLRAVNTVLGMHTSKNAAGTFSPLVRESLRGGVSTVPVFHCEMMMMDVM